MTPDPDFQQLRDGHARLERGHQELKRALLDIQAEQTRVRTELHSATRGLEENNAATKRIETNTADLVSTFVSLQGGFKVLVWIGKASIPLAIIWGGLKAWSLGILTGGIKS